MNSKFCNIFTLFITYHCVFYPQSETYPDFHYQNTASFCLTVLKNCYNFVSVLVLASLSVAL